MKIAISATLAVVVGLLAANMLGVASAEAPTTTTSPRTVSVQGVAKVPVAQGASVALATESYRQAMTAAVTDGLSKAEFLASKAGVTVGAVQSVVEAGGSIFCTEGPGSEYDEYDGEQPDFPVSGVVSAPPEFAGAVRSSKARVPVVKTKHRKAKPKAKKATVASCTLSAQVSLVYAIT